MSTGQLCMRTLTLQPTSHQQSACRTIWLAGFWKRCFATTAERLIHIQFVRTYCTNGEGSTRCSMHLSSSLADRKQYRSTGPNSRKRGVMPKLRVEDEEFDLDALEGAEWDEGEEFVDYTGPVPPKKTVLNGYVKVAYWTLDGSGERMIKSLFIA